MFSYFGRKLRLAPIYPAPEYNVVVEPFAGSMAYSLYHRPGYAVGFEINQKVHNTWHHIVNMSVEDIENYPLPKLGDVIDDHWLIQAAFSEHSSEADSRQWNVRMETNIGAQKKFALKHLDYAKNRVSYICGSYENVPDIEATWFIDPPYQHVLKGYMRHNIDYGKLAEFVYSRKGQVIVSEQEGANWLPFKQLTSFKGGNNKVYNEVVYVQ